ncbi:MAG TPA: family 78 glycoside hydrolase catalytic domain [Candidatus Hydrogenedens sp.]|nr:family 78 glycoside hydrolase catalytic domain [Candidatus Hydrogenedens sp.]
MFRIFLFEMIICVSLFIQARADSLSPIHIYDLRCEYLECPLGLDVKNPCLTWKLEAITNERGLFQKSYQILVSSTFDDIKNDIGDLWDTGKVDSDNFQVKYEGKPLLPKTKIWWKVRIWDQKGRVSNYSEPSWWETGLLENENWKGEWIEPPETLYPRNMSDKEIYHFNPALIFRKTLPVEKEIEEARMYISGLGYYECFINGKKVGDHELDPGWTNYSKKVFYSVYDITDYLKKDINIIGAYVGSGWYNPLPLKMWKRYNLREHLTIGIPKLRTDIEISYKDGTKTIIGTDETWKVTLSPIVKNNIYLGEEYDGTKDIEGWNDNPNIDESGWFNAIVNLKPNLGNMIAQPIPPIKVGKKYRPVSIKEIDKQKWLVDFGQNSACRIHIITTGTRGQKIQVRYGELLYPDGSLNPMTSVCGQIKNHDVPEVSDRPFTAEQKDVFILKGVDNEELTTHFTYHGFRYIEIEGLEKITENNIWSERLHTAVENVGSLETSETYINQIQKLCTETLLSNLHSVETDCPHREKFGYGGDIVSASEYAMFNYDMSAFYRKVVRDFADEIRPNGGFTETAPFVGIADMGLGDGSGPIAWGTVHPFLLWNLYQYYGDNALIDEQYPHAKKWLELLVKSAKDGIQTQCIGDHESIVPKQEEVTATAYYYLNAVIMQKLAGILGIEEDIKYYELLSQQIKQKFNEKFYASDGKIGIGSQANQALYIAFCMGDTNQLQQAGKILVDDVVFRGQKLTTGIFGTKYLLGVLSDLGKSELALGIVEQKEFPGWVHMIENGATTLWEHWDFSDNTFSHNHPMFGSVSEWFYKYLGGIRPTPDACAFNKVILNPMFLLPIEKVNCSYESARGKYFSVWVKHDGYISWELLLPPNCEGTVIVPKQFEKILIDNNELDTCSDIKEIKIIDNNIHFKILSGKYNFQLSMQK